MRVAHLDGIRHRAFGLIFQRGGPAVPELRQAVGAIEDSGSAAPALLSLDARGDGLPSVNANFGWWQVAQETVPSAESRLSK